ncbi:hypothetical protein F5X99DRAFT_235131 [Biscogniauxia marginata]|nr:hypothetical protein F5X99DRAFT_235131 [Biscogniauxia marginata]
MSLDKQRISSPLEAGRSILDTHNLPPHLTGALEYTSRRLARKAQHITLVVVRNDYQLPSSVPPSATPTSPPATPEYRAGFASPRFASPMAGLKQLVRRGTNSSLSSSTTSETAPSISTLSSPTFSPLPSEPLTSPRRWILPPTPGSTAPCTPMTPHTPFSTTTTTTSTSTSTTSTASSSSSTSQRQGYGFGIRLLYTSPLSPKAEKTLRVTIAKAERKFLGGWLLPPVMTATACGLNPDLMRRSILQNEILFSSEGLTLLGLDRLYTFKAALAAYARSTSYPSSPAIVAYPPPPAPLSSHPVTFAARDGGGGDNSNNSATSATTTTRLEEAVDSLRRLILLANGGRPVPKADLYRSYDWLGVNPRALSDVERMYRRAYGGPERRGPFEVTATTVVAEEEREGEAGNEGKTCRKKAAVFKIGAPPPPKTPPRVQTTPVLKLNTNIPTVVTAKKAVTVETRLIRPSPKSVGPKTQQTRTWAAEGKGEEGEAGKERGEKGSEARDPDNDINQDDDQRLLLHPRHHEQEIHKNRKSPHPGVQVDIGDLDLDLEVRIDDDDDDNDNNYSHSHSQPHQHLPLQHAGNPRSLSGGGVSIDELMLLSTPCDNNNNNSRDSHRLGPATPNGYDDISPVTRGEWGFLFQGLGAGRTVAVEKC